MHLYFFMIITVLVLCLLHLGLLPKYLQLWRWTTQVTLSTNKSQTIPIWGANECVSPSNCLVQLSTYTEVNYVQQKCSCSIIKHCIPNHKIHHILIVIITIFIITAARFQWAETKFVCKQRVFVVSNRSKIYQINSNQQNQQTSSVSFDRTEYQC